MSVAKDQQGAVQPSPAVIRRWRLLAGVCAVFATAVLLVAPVVLLVAPIESSHAAVIFQVIDPEDAPDAQLNGTCASTHLGLCTLRAAIQEAEHAGGGIVVLSTGIGDYQLTIPSSNPGEADGQLTIDPATGDLDISTNIRVDGGGVRRLGHRRDGHAPHLRRARGRHPVAQKPDGPKRNG